MATSYPYAGAIIAGARLIYGALKTEREFKAADRTTRNKIQVVQALPVMSLNWHLQPHMLTLTLNITGLTNDDLFYYKNKPPANWPLRRPEQPPT